MVAYVSSPDQPLYLTALFRGGTEKTKKVRLFPRAIAEYPETRELTIYEEDVGENATKQRYHWLKENK